MTRFLIFIGLFPAIAVAVLIALVSTGAGAFPGIAQAVALTGWGYAVGVIPALVCAVVDLLLRKTRIPPVLGTALVGYGIATLAAPTIFYRTDIGMGIAFALMPLFAPLTPDALGIAGLYLGFGLVGGIPAALCSWLAGQIRQAGPDWKMQPGSGEAR